jgi:hypothetical protein
MDKKWFDDFSKLPSYEPNILDIIEKYYNQLDIMMLKQIMNSYAIKNVDDYDMIIDILTKLYDDECLYKYLEFSTCHNNIFKIKLKSLINPDINDINKIIKDLEYFQQVKDLDENMMFCIHAKHQCRNYFLFKYFKQIFFGKQVINDLYDEIFVNYYRHNIQNIEQIDLYYTCDLKLGKPEKFFMID